MFTKSLILTAALALASFSAVADDHIDIKGLHLGMTQEEFNAELSQYGRFMSGDKPSFTIGGSYLYLGGLPEATENESNVVDNITIVIYSNSFDAIKAAFKKKYPQMQCTDNAVHNRMNATFTQTKCDLSTKTEAMHMERYAGDLQTGGIRIQSFASMKKEHAQKNTAKNDL
jgi:hypothetical protein